MPAVKSTWLTTATVLASSIVVLFVVGADDFFVLDILWSHSICSVGHLGKALLTNTGQLMALERILLHQMCS